MRNVIEVLRILICLFVHLLNLFFLLGLFIGLLLHFSRSDHFPQDDGSVVAAGGKQELLIAAEEDLSDVRTVACKRLAVLPGDGDWVGKESDLLVISAGGNQGPGRTHGDAVSLAVVHVLMDLLHAESEFARPTCPLHVSA